MLTNDVSVHNTDATSRQERLDTTTSNAIPQPNRGTAGREANGASLQHTTIAQIYAQIARDNQSETVASLQVWTQETSLRGG